MNAGNYNDITFILTSCGRFDLLEKTLESFLHYNTAPIRRYLLIEDSGDEAVRRVTEKMPVPIEVIVNNPKLGHMASLDRVYNEVKTPLVFHCEDDWQFTRSGFIEKSIILLKNDPSISIVCCRDLMDREDLKLIQKQDLSKIDDVEFRYWPANLSKKWGGFTLNPGLWRMSDYRELGSFVKWGHESDANLFFKRRGMRVAFLNEPACYTTGRQRRLPKQTAVRRLWSRVMRTWTLRHYYALRIWERLKS